MPTWCTALHDDGWPMLQVTETGADLGPGLQAALRSFGNALDKLPTIQIRNPNMYSLAHSSKVRELAAHDRLRQPCTSVLCCIIPVWAVLDIRLHTWQCSCRMRRP